MHVVVEHIERPPTESWRYQVRSEASFPFSWHRHREYELTLITEGHGLRMVGDSCAPYRPGDLALIGANVPHSYASESRRDGGSHTAVTVLFDRDFLGTGLFHAAEFASVADMLGASGRGLALTGEAATSASSRLATLGELSGLTRTLELLSILGSLASATRSPLASPSHRAGAAADSDDLTDRVCGHLLRSYQSPLTLDDIAAHAHLTPNALSRRFRRATGQSVIGYLIEMRVAEASRLLVDTDWAVADIATASGYSSLANFNRQFRRSRGVTPRDYRRRWKAAARPLHRLA